jgi:hypothetical protein|tara:strand:+ start:12279 stop:13256 length:978 start_codon:yes stop_codon:yes gene_type:complete
MFNTKNIVLDERNIPSTWVFQYYLNLPEQLTGQNIKIKSIFNPNDKTPSFCIYVNETIMQYKFKDFSTGKNGNKVDLVKSIFNIEYPEASRKIVKDYNMFVKTNGVQKIDFKPESKWVINYIKERSWTITDKKYWLSFRIGKTILDEFNVRPIEYYTLVKENSNKVENLRCGSKWCYGYFDKNGEVYKIYQPFSKKYKFYKAKSYLQGIDQLKFNKPYLVICSSLKDALCLKGMGYNVEVLAPDSENTIIKPHIIEHLKKKYKKVITLFDNDQAGLEAIEKYKNLYGLHGCVLSMSKDISDAIKNYGLNEVHAILKPLLKQTLSK